MKNLMCVLIVAVFCTVSFAASASGVLVDAKGAVTVAAPGGKNVAAKIGAELPDGTKISVASGASASVMFMDGSIQEIGPGEKYTIGGAEKPAGKRTVIEGIALAMNEATSASGSTVHGMVKMTQPGVNPAKPNLVGIGGSGPQGIYPVETAIEMAPEVIFQWSQRVPINFANPVIVFDDASKKQITYKKIVPSSGKIAVKAEESKLAPGNSYSWYLAADENGNILGKSKRFNFSILSEAEKAKLDSDKAKVQSMNISEDGKKFLTAQLYYRSKMTDAMVKELVPLWQKNRSDTIKRLLFIAYAHMGRPEEAKKYQ